MAHEKHTPGPWRVREMGTNERGPVLAIQSELYTIAEYIQPIDDARLIAAAPKLLAALQGLVDHAYRNNPEGLPYPLRDAVEVATDAIAEAVGE